MADNQGTFTVLKVGNNGPTDPSAILDISSTSGGFLLPRMTTVQRLAIVSPTTGLQVFDLTLGLPYSYAPSGWTPLGSGGGGGGSGSVTSVALADGSTTPIYNISGSPVTGSGTLVFNLTTQSANKAFLGPISGSASQPTFRNLILTDLPTGLGTVTSVSLSGASPVFTVSGNPVTGSGTISMGLAQPLSNGQAVVTNASGQFVSAVFSSTPTANALATWDGNENMFAAGFISKLTSTATAGTTTTLTVSSNKYQMFTGSSNQTVVLPVASVTSNSQGFVIINTSTGSVTVNTSGGNTLQIMAANTVLEVTCINQSGGTGLASWSWNYYNYQGGSVTSVGLTLPNIFTVSNSTVTASGSLTAVLANQSANTALMGPTGGSATTPAFRVLAAADIPALSYVTSVGFNDGSTTPIFNISGSPVTTTGTLVNYLKTQSPNIGFFGPTGGSAAQPTFRSLAAVDIGQNIVPVSGLAQIATNTILGNNTTGTSNVTALTTSQVNTLLNLASASSTYSQAYFGQASSWSTTSTSFVDPTNTGGNALTVRNNANLTLTAASSSLCGISLTPPSTSAAYLISAQVGVYQSVAGDAVFLQLIDGSGTVIALSPGWVQSPTTATSADTITIQGIYVPGTTSAVTVKLQAATNGGTASIQTGGSSSQGNSVEWTVIQINPQASTVNLSGGNISGVLPASGGGFGFSDPFYNYAATGQQGISGTGGSLVSINNFAFHILANETWQFECHIVGVPIVTTHGVFFGVNGPAGSTVLANVYGNTTAVGTYSQSVLGALNTATAVSFLGVTGVTGFTKIWGTMANGSTSGTCQIQFAPQTTSDGWLMYTGSYIVSKRIS